MKLTPFQLIFALAALASVTNASDTTDQLLAANGRTSFGGNDASYELGTSFDSSPFSLDDGVDKKSKTDIVTPNGPAGKVVAIDEVLFEDSSISPIQSSHSSGQDSPLLDAGSLNLSRSSITTTEDLTLNDSTIHLDKSSDSVLNTAMLHSSGNALLDTEEHWPTTSMAQSVSQNELNAANESKIAKKLEFTESLADTLANTRPTRTGLRKITSADSEEYEPTQTRTVRKARQHVSNQTLDELLATGKSRIVTNAEVKSSALGTTEQPSRETEYQLAKKAHQERNKKENAERLSAAQANEAARLTRIAKEQEEFEARKRRIEEEAAKRKLRDEARQREKTAARERADAIRKESKLLETVAAKKKLGTRLPKNGPVSAESNNSEGSTTVTTEYPTFENRAIDSVLINSEQKLVKAHAEELARLRREDRAKISPRTTSSLGNNVRPQKVSPVPVKPKITQRQKPKTLDTVAERTSMASIAHQLPKEPRRDLFSVDDTLHGLLLKPILEEQGDSNDNADFSVTTSSSVYGGEVLEEPASTIVQTAPLLQAEKSKNPPIVTSKTAKVLKLDYSESDENSDTDDSLTSEETVVSQYATPTVVHDKAFWMEALRKRKAAKEANKMNLQTIATIPAVVDPAVEVTSSNDEEE